MKTEFAHLLSTRRTRQAIVGVALAAAAASSHGSDFYRLSVVAESSSEWRITPGTLGINNAGVITWRADRLVDGAFEGGIFIGDGATQTLIATGTVFNPAINNLGQVSFFTSIVTPSGTAGATRLWTSGVLSEICISGQQPTPLVCQFGTLSENGRGTYRSGTAFGVVAPLNQVIAEANLQEINFAGFEPVINRSGRRAAFAGGAGGLTNRISIADPTIPGGSAILFASPGVPSTVTLTGLSINDLGNTAFVARGGASTTLQRLVGVASPSGASGSYAAIATTAGGQFIDFAESPSINNLNEVAFVGQAIVPGSTVRPNLPFVGDVSGRAPTPVAAFNEAIATGGAVVGGVSQNGFHAHSMNDKGQIAFLTTLSRPGGGSVNAIVRADPLPGVSPGNPIMPDAASPLPSGWRFVLRCFPASLCAGSAPRRYIDPPLAVGYAYQVEAPGPNVATVYIPAPLPNGDDTFQVEFNGQTATLRAGVPFDFTILVPGGVSSFRITGIDTSEVLDPTNATAFVTGLTFATDATTDFSMTMVPIVVDPDDTDLDGVLNGADLCPNTAFGAAVDGNGCSADQRDSDGDGVVDSRDLCPATPPGATVDANGCSTPQLDADGDGVPNATDACPNTPPGAAVDARGCSSAQRDTDGDGVNDASDLCPNTPSGAAVNPSGCALSQLDSDGDGVKDDIDACPGTAPGTAVDSRGCPLPPPPSTTTCDVNNDKFIDYRDIRLILSAVGKPAVGATDPRDANGNGKIDLIDAAICTKKCDRNFCLPPK